jgi:hypothetical protein
MLSCLNDVYLFLGVYTYVLFFCHRLPKGDSTPSIQDVSRTNAPEGSVHSITRLSVTIVLVSCVVPTQGYGACCQV